MTDVYHVSCFCDVPVGAEFLMYNGCAVHKKTDTDCYRNLSDGGDYPEVLGCMKHFPVMSVRPNA